MLLVKLIHLGDVEQKDGEVVGEERGMEKRLEQRTLCSEILPFTIEMNSRVGFRSLYPLVTFRSFTFRYSFEYFLNNRCSWK